MSAKLTELPPELLAQVFPYLESVRALSHLSLTCKKIHWLVQSDGFRIFVQSRFPSLATPLPAPTSVNAGQAPWNPYFWRDAAHEFTALSRNWDRRAFVAQRIGPYDGYSQPDKNRQRSRRRRTGQTMGFVPVIDSYEQWDGGDWNSRKQVLAWGAGAGLVLRTEERGARAGRRQTDKSVPPPKLDVHGHQYQWMMYDEGGAVDGRDDITTLNFLPRSGLEDREDLIVGRANGRLTKVSLSAGKPRSRVPTTFVTGERPLRSATIEPGTNSIMAACLSDSAVALYNTTKSESFVSAEAHTSVLPSQATGRTWSSRFLKNTRLAVGYGPSLEPIKIYDIDRGLDERSAQTLIVKPETGSNSTSVYSLAPLAGSSAGGADGDVFLSGGYDGLIRLHDLRCYDTVSTFKDPVDTFSPIYSLLPLGRERFLAGGAMHSLLKIFDLRMPGGKMYNAADLDPCKPGSEQLSSQSAPPKCNPFPSSNQIPHHRAHHPSDRHHPSHNPQLHPPKPATNPSLSPCCQHHQTTHSNLRSMNLFLGRDDRAHNRVTSNRPGINSPVYSLSSPSASSPTFFAGIESTVLQIDVVSVMDRHISPSYREGPNPSYRDAPNGNGAFARGPIEKWDPLGRVVSLHAYQHDDGPVNLIKQRLVGETRVKGGELDERWAKA